jgi:hypothetical protein
MIMTVVAGDLVLYLAEYRPTDDIDPAGGTDSTTVISDSIVGEFLPNDKANIDGGAIIYQYQKSCLKNDNTADTFYDPVYYIPESIDDLSADSIIKFLFDSTVDASNTSMYIIGQDSTGAPQTETLAIGGSGSKVSSSKTWADGPGGLIEVTVKSTGSGALKDLSVGNVIIYDASDAQIGKIFKDQHSAHANLYLWVEGTINADTTSANRTTAPGGASWSKPRVYTDGIAGADDLGPADYQGLWTQQILYDGQQNIPDANGEIAWYGGDA